MSQKRQKYSASLQRAKMAQLTGTVSSVNAPNFAVNNLATLFTSNGITQVQVVVSSLTEFEGVSGSSALATGNNVVLARLALQDRRRPYPRGEEGPQAVSG